MASNPAVKLVKKYGSNGKVAKIFGLSREAVRQWIEKCIPPKHALDVEELTDGDISAMEILRFAKQRERRAA